MRPDLKEIELKIRLAWSHGTLKAVAGVVAAFAAALGAVHWDKLALLGGSLFTITLLCTLATPVLAQSSTHYCPTYVQAWAFSPDPGFPPCWPGSSRRALLKAVAPHLGGGASASPPFFLR